MKPITGGESKGMLGEFQFTHECRRGVGHRIIWNNPPPSGTKLINHGDQVTVDGIGMAGMVLCTRKKDIFQCLVFPWDLKLPNKRAVTAGGEE